MRGHVGARRLLRAAGEDIGLLRAGLADEGVARRDDGQCRVAGGRAVRCDRTHRAGRLLGLLCSLLGGGGGARLRLGLGVRVGLQRVGERMHLIRHLKLELLLLVPQLASAAAR